MPNVKANGIQIEYDTFGNRGSRPLLLVMGLGTQMIAWDEDFCQQLAEQGHYVIRFDNRDVGLSTKFEGAGLPNVLKAMAAAAKGEEVRAPYTLDDMAEDTVGLLEALGLATAHVCGASMGGMIGQTLAIRHPSRLQSLISIMSSTGNPKLPPAQPEAMKALMKPPPAERAAFIEHMVQTWRTIAGRGFPFDEDRMRAQMARAFDRCFCPAGAARQMMAIIAHGNRKPALAGVRTPTLVIHGADDPLIPVAAGRDTAEAIPGAELLILEGMGHDLPPALWPRLVDAIAGHTQKAEKFKG
ncbi:MAG: alpha/beta hydrolase [Deltaproteobacteria bacterium RBG_13_61_14]|nr:MAG: alpha/beta hydrolase [Deltaproteobacteria bacterium RBG_13_61_14]